MRFPQSRYADDAKQHMIFIRNLLAQHELEVAQYYFDNKIYLAAANRANIVILNYQKTPAVEDALLLLVDAYRKMGLIKLASDAQKVYNYNYTHPT